MENKDRIRLVLENAKNNADFKYNLTNLSDKIGVTRQTMSRYIRSLKENDEVLETMSFSISDKILKIYDEELGTGEEFERVQNNLKGILRGGRNYYTDSLTLKVIDKLDEKLQDKKSELLRDIISSVKK